MYTVNIKYANDQCEIKRGTEGAFAFDVNLNSDVPITVKAGEKVKLPTGVFVDLGDKLVGMLATLRSGLSTKNSLILLNSVGVVDSDYTGEMFLVIGNLGFDGDYTFKPYERIAQVMFIKSVDVNLNIVTELNETVRGDGGFGHTGK